MTDKATIGVLGGSFNPVHMGHLLLADYLVQFTDVDAVWLMLSPQNPLKTPPRNTASDCQRMAMLELACENANGIEPCGIELDMPKPSYTIDSLRALQSRYPSFRFRLVIGSDNWAIFDQWKCHSEIIEHFTPMIYPRPGYPVAADTLTDGVAMAKAPMFDISSTFIREATETNHDMSLYLPQGVWDYIKQNNLYR